MEEKWIKLLQGWGLEPLDISLTSQHLVRIWGLEADFNHMAKDSINYVYMVKPR